MTDTTLTVVTTNADGGNVSLTLGAPVNQIFSGTVANNQSTIVVPDTVLLPSISADVTVIAQVTAGALSAQGQAVLRNSGSTTTVPTTTPSITQWGETLTGSSATITVEHPEGVAGQSYDVRWRIAGATDWNDPFSSQGFGSALTWNFTGLPTNGQTIEFSIFHWVGAFDANTVEIEIGSVTAHTPVIPSGALTFAEIRTAAEATRASGGPAWNWHERDANGNFTSAWNIDKHVAAFYYLHPTVDYHEVNGESVVVVPTPQAPADVRTLPAPSGGEDAPAILSFINANAPHKTFTGLGRIYRISNLILPAGVQIWDMPSTGCTSTYAHRVNQPDVRYYNCPVNAPGSSTQSGWRIDANGHRCHVIQGAFSNFTHTANLNVCGVFIDDNPTDLVISRLVCENLINNGPTATSATRLIWANGGGSAPSPSGRITNCSGKEFRSNGTTQDAELITIQFHTGSSGTLLCAANSHDDAGKRVFKIQGTHDVNAYFNSGRWTKSSTATAQFVSAAVATMLGSSDIDASMNFFDIGNAAPAENVLSFRNANAQNNVHMDFNDMKYDAGTSGASNQGIQIEPSTFTGNSSGLGNWLYGSGQLKYGYRHRGSPDIGDFDKTGTRFDVTLTQGEVRNG